MSASVPAAPCASSLDPASSSSQDRSKKNENPEGAAGLDYEILYFIESAYDHGGLKRFAAEVMQALRSSSPIPPSGVRP